MFRVSGSGFRGVLEAQHKARLQQRELNLAQHWAGFKKAGTKRIKDFGLLSLGFRADTLDLGFRVISLRSRV